MIERKFGWQPDIPDHRDFTYKITRPKFKFPNKVDLRSQCSKVEDQGELGSCTANALAGALEFLEIKEKLVPYEDRSRLFIYYNERVIEHTIKTDAGAQIRDGIKTLAKQGVCSEASWPYNIASFTKKPPTALYAEARDHTITSYSRLSTLQDMMSCLADGYPFVFGFAVYESFMSEKVAKNGILNMPLKSEKNLGGHAVMAAGYNNTLKRFIVRNSWGSDWGQYGYFTMPYAYVASRDLSDDFWTIRKENL